MNTQNEVRHGQGALADSSALEEKEPKKVLITINGKGYHVLPGRHSVVQLKNLAEPKIPEEDTLCIIIDGIPKPLENKGHVEIRGGEVFASNCPSGGAS